MSLIVYPLVFGRDHIRQCAWDLILALRIGMLDVLAVAVIMPATLLLLLLLFILHVVVTVRTSSRSSNRAHTRVTEHEASFATMDASIDNARRLAHIPNMVAHLVMLNVSCKASQ